MTPNLEKNIVINLKGHPNYRKMKLNRSKKGTLFPKPLFIFFYF